MDNMDNKDKRSNLEDEILGIIREIMDLASDGEYIYRGQPGNPHPKPDAPHPKPDAPDPQLGDTLPKTGPSLPLVTSTLYRALFRELENRYKENGDEEWFKWFYMKHDMNLVQEEALESARKFTSEEHNNKEMLSRIQHYSGDTNLIDFTKDYLVALFFACNHKYDENGGVFLLKTSKLKDSEIEMITPVHPPNRVTAQKSVFVQSRTGVIRKKLMKIVEIPRELKQPILDYLKEHHDISLSTIYNDLHGYIRNSKEHGDAVMEFYLGLDYNHESENAQLSKDKIDTAEKAMEHFSKAILLDPKYVRAYNNRGNANFSCGIAKQNMGNASDVISDCEKAISDYENAIALDHKYVWAYNNRGNARLLCGNIKLYHEIANRESRDVSGALSDYEKAISDYDKAIALDPKYVNAYYNRGNAKRDYGDAKLSLRDVLGAISDYKDAISDYDKAIALAPHKVGAYNNRGTVKRKYRDAKRNLDDVSVAISGYKDAISDYNKAIALVPDNVIAYNNRGNAKQSCGDTKREFNDASGAKSDYKDAINDYDKAIALAPDDAMAYYNRGLTKKKLGDGQNLQQALFSFEKTKKLALKQNKKELADIAQENIGIVTAKMNKP